MKLCFSTLGCSELSLEEILTLANRFSIPAVEFRGISGELDHRLIPDWREENEQATKECFQRHGVLPLVLGTSCVFHDEERLPLFLDEGKESIRIASRFSIPALRVFGNDLTADHEACFARVARGIAVLCEEAKDKGVQIYLEVHGNFNTIQTLDPIVNALKDYDNFGLIWDVCHTHLPYGEQWQPFYERFASVIRHIHIKGYSNEKHAQVLPGTGDIPIEAILRRLIKDGFDGYVSLEWERRWNPALEPIEVALAHFTALCAKAEEAK